MTTTIYYRNSALYPAITAILLTLVFSVVDNRDYKSEWLTSDSVIGMTLMTSIVYSVILCMSCLTIFLLNIEVFKKNKLWTALSWFLIPFVCIATFLTHEIGFNLKYNESLGNDFVYVTLMNLPFIVGLIWTYLRYRQNNYR
jgi:hypothetical protein